MTVNIAHRGACSLAPENTLAAARKALALGADMWECDVSVTRDQALVVFHDDSLKRLTNAAEIYPDRSPWTITEFTLEEVRRLSAGWGYLAADPYGQIAAGNVSAEDRDHYRRERIPTLEEALLFTREAGWRINIELKKVPPPMDRFPVVERVLDLIGRLGIAPEHIVFSSFNHQWLRRALERRPDIPVEALIGFWTDRPLDWGDLSFTTYSARWPLITPEEIRVMAGRGIRVKAWVVNEPEQMQRLIDAGAAGILTDFPQRLALLLQRRPDARI